VGEHVRRDQVEWDLRESQYRREVDYITNLRTEGKKTLSTTTKGDTLKAREGISDGCWG